MTWKYPKAVTKAQLEIETRKSYEANSPGILNPNSAILILGRYFPILQSLVLLYKKMGGGKQI